MSAPHAQMLHTLIWGDFMNSCELTMSVTALAKSIACQLSDDNLALAAAVLTQLGDTLATISTQRSLCSEKNHTEKRANKGC